MGAWVIALIDIRIYYNKTMTRQVDSEDITLAENETYNGRLKWDTLDTKAGEYTVTVQGDTSSYSFTVDLDAAIIQPLSDDLTHFTGDTGAAFIDSSSPVAVNYPTDLSLKLNSGGSNVGIASGSGLPYYPQTDDVWRVWWYGAKSQIPFIWASDNTGLFSGDQYELIIEGGSTNPFSIRVRQGGSPTTLATSSTDLSSNTFYEFEVSHASTGDVTATVYDIDGNSLETITATDSNLITSGSFDNNAIEIANANGGSDMMVDFWRITQR